MNHTVAEEDLKVISGLLEEWRKTGRLGGLEYDLLLDKIKSLYETVRFGGGQLTMMTCSWPLWVTCAM